jgi:hypothetical protein
MPHRRCLTCGQPTLAGSRCPACRAGRKRARNAEARRLGPCPQDGVCWRCDGQPTPTDPLTWDHRQPRGHSVHWPPGVDAKPAHLSCNSRARDRQG